LCARFPSNKVRGIIAFGTFIISLLYMVPQLVAAGLLIRLLLDIDYSVSVMVIGGLMTVYVVFGGMIATSWLQIVKTIVLLSGTFLLSLMVFSRYGWKICALLFSVRQGTILGHRLFLPVQLYQIPLELFSLLLALILATAGLPHI